MLRCRLGWLLALCVPATAEAPVPNIAAIRAGREDVLAHPENSPAHVRYAQALADAGAEELAVAEARKGTECDPESAQAWLTLGVVLERDSFGRLRIGDWRPQEAEKALLKALDLSHRNRAVVNELGELFEFDSAGYRFAKDARLGESIDLYHEFVAKGPNPGVSENLAALFLNLGQYNEARREVEKMSVPPKSPYLAMVLDALTDGIDKAIADIKRASSDPAAQASQLSTASWAISQYRFYPEAIELLKAVQRSHDDPFYAKQISFLSGLKHFEEALAPRDDPKRPVQEMLALIGTPIGSEDGLKTLLSSQAEMAQWLSEIQRGRQRLDAVRHRTNMNGEIIGMMPDLLVNPATLNLTVKGNGSPAYTVEIVSELQPGAPVVFVVRENGGCRLLATGDQLDQLGDLALEALKKGNLPAAQAWLDLAGKPRDERTRAFRHLWSGTTPESRKYHLCHDGRGKPSGNL